MQRRSFFSVVFGGFLARWLPLPKQLRFRGAVIPITQYQPCDPKYHFGFMGFKPAEAYAPMVGGRYAADQPMFQDDGNKPRYWEAAEVDLDV